MSVWQKLTEITEENLWRGNVLRFPASFPYESIADLMLICSASAESGFSLIVATGYKAGHIKLELPKAAKSKTASAISLSWLIDNWQSWVYPECTVDEVDVLQNYPSNIKTNGG